MGKSNYIEGSTGRKESVPICLSTQMGSEEKWVEFRCENLPYVCYYCRVLEHTERSFVLCEEDMRNENIKRDQFDIWMRAENQGLTANNSRRQGNQYLRSPILMYGKRNQVAEHVEGTDTMILERMPVKLLNKIKFSLLSHHMNFSINLRKWEKNQLD